MRTRRHRQADAWDECEVKDGETVRVPMHLVDYGAGLASATRWAGTLARYAQTRPRADQAHLHGLASGHRSVMQFPGASAFSIHFDQCAPRHGALRDHEAL